ncbi:MAG: hypothetical protein INR71_01135 [Terriglobus roseus]|nr:hypothetical protein [Terriglobus roseus]
MTGGAVMADPAASISSFRQALLGMQGGSSEQRLHMMNGYSGDMSVNDHPPPAFDNFAHPLEEDPAVGPTEPLSPIGLVDQPEPAEMLANGTDEAEVPVDPHLEAMAVEQPVPAAQPTAASPENRTRSTSPMSELSDVPPSSPTEIQTTIEEPGSAAEVKDEAVARDMRGMSGASAETGVDDESARLARELQSQEFGLRMRSMRSK